MHWKTEARLHQGRSISSMFRGKRSSLYLP
ncbi:unnamed protein product [Strongylus vulgaris]|uniref:Uncharacterized protein n=1 Tax=Strongylus vulgaris TaxID=40348 RepID=A0A3P7K3H1_STRVU|nr:unnamed protein product [Strongylus vulgaris]